MPTPESIKAIVGRTERVSSLGMTALIVHAHHERQSFSSALFRQASNTLTELGYAVETSDLYAMAWDPVSGRRNFSSVLDSSYLKQQAEERHATEVNGFADTVESEIRKLESCDVLIFSFPLWWYGMPAILKGWVDRVFAMSRTYGGSKKFEKGLGRSEKRAMVILTTGGNAVSFGGYGMNLSLDSVLKPIEHGVFWFNGFLPLEPFVAWNPARASLREREEYLTQLDERLRRLPQEPPRHLPLQSDFGDDGTDQKKRFMVVTCYNGNTGEWSPGRGWEGLPQLRELQRNGVLLTTFWSQTAAGSWKGFLVFREGNRERVREHLQSLPPASFPSFEISELARV
jgi:NAD(P)H dehydrogenase (quinone)